MSSTNSFLQSLPKAIVDEINATYTDAHIIVSNTSNLMRFFLDTRKVDLFLDHLVPHSIDVEVIYDIAWRLARMTKGVTDEQRTRLLQVKNTFLLKRKDQRKEIQKQVIGVKREIEKGVIEDRENNKRQKLDMRNFFATVRGNIFDSVILSNIFKYFFHFTQYRNRLVCKGFNSAYLSASNNYILLNSNPKSAMYKKCVLSMMMCVKDRKPDIDISNYFLDIERIRIKKDTIPGWSEENYNSEMNVILKRFLENQKYSIYYHSSSNTLSDNVLNVQNYYITRDMDPLFLRLNFNNFISHMNKNVSNIRKTCPKTLFLYSEHIFNVKYNVEIPSVKYIVIIDENYPTERKQSLTDYKIGPKHLEYVTKIFPNCKAIYLTHSLQKDNESEIVHLGTTKYNFNKTSILIFAYNNLYFPY